MSRCRGITVRGTRCKRIQSSEYCLQHETARQPGFRLLTVGEVRQRYWNEHKKRGSPISFGTTQTFGNTPTSVRELEPYVFVPTGDLRKYNRNTQQSEILKDWLSLNSNGPYFKRGSSDILYYLLGTYLEGQWGKGPGELQVCSNPLNALSENCLDEIHCWVTND